jgi:hypothetical protein
MSLPKKHEKGYLELTRLESGWAVVGKKEHLDELAILFSQRGLPCHRGPEVSGDHEALLFDANVDVAQVEEILDPYKHEKGS